MLGWRDISLLRMIEGCGVKKMQLPLPEAELDGFPCECLPGYISAFGMSYLPIFYLLEDL